MSRGQGYQKKKNGLGGGVINDILSTTSEHKQLGRQHDNIKMEFGLIGLEICNKLKNLTGPTAQYYNFLFNIYIL